MSHKKNQQSKKSPKLINIFCVLLVFFLGAFYLYQSCSVAGLEYQLEQVRGELRSLEEDYQGLSMSKNKSWSLEDIRSKTKKLDMVDVRSPVYLLDTEKEFAQRN